MLPPLADVPAIIGESGRVKGFEAIRDMLLASWQYFARSSNPLAVLKSVLEMDRHALFAEVAAIKASGKFDQDKWEAYQRYLAGEVQAPPEGSAEAPRQEASHGGEPES